MKAAILWGSVNVWNSSEAEVRNSAVSEMLVTLIFRPGALTVVGCCPIVVASDDLLTEELE